MLRSFLHALSRPFPYVQYPPQLFGPNTLKALNSKTLTDPRAVSLRRSCERMYAAADFEVLDQGLASWHSMRVEVDSCSNEHLPNGCKEELKQNWKFQ